MALVSTVSMLDKKGNIRQSNTNHNYMLSIRTHQKQHDINELGE